MSAADPGQLTYTTAAGLVTRSVPTAAPDDRAAHVVYFTIAVLVVG